jgi:hypothetical protein
MADILRLVSMPLTPSGLPGARNVVIRDYENGTTYQKSAGTFAINPPARTPNMTVAQGRYGGSRSIGELNENGSISWDAFVSGATADIALTNIEAMITDLESFNMTNRYHVEFRAHGATRSTFFEVRGPATWNPKYAWNVFAGTQAVMITVSIPVAPLGKLLPCDVWDDFSVDSSADYTIDAGVGTDFTITGGTMNPAGTMTTERRLTHTATGYSHTEVQATLKAAPGTTITSFKAGVVMRRVDASNYLEVYVDDDGTNTRLRLDSIAAGVRSNRATLNVTPRLTAGGTFWVRGTIEGNFVLIEYFSGVVGSLYAPPTPSAAPTSITAYTLTGAEANFVGPSGISWIPQQATAQIDEFESLPYTFKSHNLPDVFNLRTPIPGTADAQVDFTYTNAPGSSVIPIWAYMGWCARLRTYNLISNGDFEADADGWSAAAASPVQSVAGTSIARDTASFLWKYGRAGATLATPASVGAGANFTVYGRFLKKVPVTATIWVASSVSTGTNWRLVLGDDNSNAASATAAISAVPRQYTVTYTPNFDSTRMILSLQQTAATAASSVILDGAVMYTGVGATAPTLGRHAEGAGGSPPFGIIESESSDTGDIAGWAVVSNAAFRLGRALYIASAVAGTYTGGWWIDPSVMVADDFKGDIDIEFFGRFRLHTSNVTPTVALSADPEQGTNYGATRYTSEYGSAGKILVKPTSGSTDRLTRLGTLTFPVDPRVPTRWKLRLVAVLGAATAGDFGLDYIFAAPSLQRVGGATAKPNDSFYPKWIASTNETTRITTTDLRGFAYRPSFSNPQPTAGHMGGAQIEFPATPIDVLVKTSSTVPDDPTIDNTADAIEHLGAIHLSVWPRVYLFRGA